MSQGEASWAVRTLGANNSESRPDQFPNPNPAIFSAIAEEQKAQSNKKQGWWQAVQITLKHRQKNLHFNGRLLFTSLLQLTWELWNVSLMTNVLAPCKWKKRLKKNNFSSHSLNTPAFQHPQFYSLAKGDPSENLIARARAFLLSLW